MTGARDRSCSPKAAATSGPAKESPRDLDLNGMTMLVTGGAGLIGSFTVDQLLKDYPTSTVKIMDCLYPTNYPDGMPDWVPKQCEFIQKDMRDREALKKALTGVDVVFHIAAVGFESTSKTQISDAVLGNSDATAVLFDVIRELKGLAEKEGKPFQLKKVLVSSSQAVYGEASYMRPDGTEFIATQQRDLSRLKAGKYEVVDENGVECTKPYAVKEDRRLEAEIPYSLTKLIHEKLAMWAGRDIGIPVVALRYSITHGPRQSIHNPYTGVIAFFATMIMNGKSPVVYEDGLQTRDFHYASDVANANIMAMISGKTNGRVLNVGTGRTPPTMLHVAEVMCELLGKEKNIKPSLPGQYRQLDCRHMQLDSTELRALGWKPKVSIEEGLKIHCQWMLDEQAKKGVPKDYYSTMRDAQLKSGYVRSTE